MTLAYKHDSACDILTSISNQSRFQSAKGWPVAGWRTAQRGKIRRIQGRQIRGRLRETEGLLLDAHNTRRLRIYKGSLSLFPSLALRNSKRQKGLSSNKLAAGQTSFKVVAAHFPVRSAVLLEPCIGHAIHKNRR